MMKRWSVAVVAAVACVHADAAIDCVDLSGETARHSVVAAGTPTLYNGHPSTILSRTAVRQQNGGLSPQNGGLSP